MNVWVELFKGSNGLLFFNYIIIDHLMSGVCTQISAVSFSISILQTLNMLMNDTILFYVTSLQTSQS